MKILAVADEEAKSLWDYYDPERTKGVDLIISCGDLKAAYLEFLVTMVNCPLLYVRGNHDAQYDQEPPRGCIPIDDRVYDFNGLRIAGLGGCMRYHDGPDMYTEAEMRRRISRLTPQIALRGGVDLVVTHAPAAGYGDLEDLPHRGYACFNDLLERWKPPYMLHGHVHRTYDVSFQRGRLHTCGTRIVNAYEYTVLDIGEEEYPAQGHTGSGLYDLYMNIRAGSRHGTH